MSESKRTAPYANKYMYVHTYALKSEYHLRRDDWDDLIISTVYIHKSETEILITQCVLRKQSLIEIIFQIYLNKSVIKDTTRR